jgi:hypothetical protein
MSMVFRDDVHKTKMAQTGFKNEQIWKPTEGFELETQSKHL